MLRTEPLDQGFSQSFSPSLDGLLVPRSVGEDLADFNFDTPIFDQLSRSSASPLTIPSAISSAIESTSTLFVIGDN